MSPLHLAFRDIDRVSTPFRLASQDEVSQREKPSTCRDVGHDSELRDERVARADADRIHVDEANHVARCPTTVTNRMRRVIGAERVSATREGTRDIEAAVRRQRDRSADGANGAIEPERGSRSAHVESDVEATVLAV